MHVIWYRQGYSDVIAHGTTLELRKVRLTNQGTYVCQCRKNNGFMSRSKGVLEVIGMKTLYNKILGKAYFKMSVGFYL